MDGVPVALRTPAPPAGSRVWVGREIMVEADILLDDDYEVFDSSGPVKNRGLLGSLATEYPLLIGQKSSTSPTIRSLACSFTPGE